MLVSIGSTQELQQILSYLKNFGDQMTALQTAVSMLQTDVQALSAAVTANQANQFTAQDVSNIQAIDTQVKALVASLTPAPPTPPTPAAS